MLAHSELQYLTATASTKAGCKPHGVIAVLQAMKVQWVAAVIHCVLPAMKF